MHGNPPTVCRPIDDAKFRVTQPTVDSDQVAGLITDSTPLVTRNRCVDEQRDEKDGDTDEPGAGCHRNVGSIVADRTLRNHRLEWSVWKEIAHRAPECLGELEEMERRAIADPAFNAAHVRARNARQIGQRLLRELLLLPDRPNPRSETLQSRMSGRLTRLPWHLARMLNRRVLSDHARSATTIAPDDTIVSSVCVPTRYRPTSGATNRLGTGRDTTLGAGSAGRSKLVGSKGGA